MSLRITFMGTPDFAVPVLRRLADDGHTIAAVYTRAPKPAGRGMALMPSPVHRLAEAIGTAVETPRTLRDPAAAATFAGHRPDLAVVVAYGLILPKAILEVPPLGCLNLHASLLPRWRGAAPIQRAIMAGDTETGVAVMRMEEGLDTGPVAAEARTPIGADETAAELHDRLAALGADLMGEAVRRLEQEGLRFAPQPADGVTYAAKIDKAESRIDWTRPAAILHDHIRGLSPFPGAWFEVDLGRGPERIKVIRSSRAEGRGAPGSLLDDQGTVACGDGAVRLIEIQRAGRAPMSFAEFTRGARAGAGLRFG